MKPFDPEKFTDRRILVAGDFMIDEYLWGDVERISPEAPVQIVEVAREEYMLGGAGNVVRNLASLGAKVSAAGVVGKGRDGDNLLDLMRNLDVDIEGMVPDPDRPTTRKTRIIAANQHVLRIDRETRKNISEKTFETILRNLRSQIPDSDLVLVSDYGKGTLTESLLAEIVRICKKSGKMVLADPKGLDFKKYEGVTLITPNRKEASLASKIEIVDDRTMCEAASHIMEKTRTDKLLITLGKDGMALFEGSTAPYRIGTEARQVFDVSGAGDTVLAVMGLALASGSSFRQAAALANTAAGIVVGKVGTAAVTQKQLSRAYAPELARLSHKYSDIDDLKNVVADLRRRGRKIVFTNGCFDLIHPGHIQFLSESKRMGDVLVVAADDDRSVRAIKGAGRPIVAQENRVGILSALDSVDHVTVFSSDRLLDLIETIRPDILTKGSNYKTEEVFGRELVERYGGEVRLVPIVLEISSTSIINEIRKNERQFKNAPVPD